MARRLSMAAVMLALLLGSGACTSPATTTKSAGGAGAGSTAGSGSGAAAPSPGGSGAAGRTPGPVGSTAGSAGSDGFSYLPWGPEDPPVPGQYAALAASANSPPRCDQVAQASPGGPFWSTAVAVCRAVAGIGAWPATTAVPTPPAAPNSYQACLNDELASMLRRSLRWHAGHPQRRPRVTFAAGSSRSPCQSRIYRVQVLQPTDPPSDGTAPGRLPLAITAAGMDGDSVVSVDGQPTEVTGEFQVPSPGDGLETVVVLTPYPPSPHTARISVTTGHGILLATVRLPAAPPPTVQSTATDPSTGATATGGSDSPSPPATAAPSESVQTLPAPDVTAS